jgi:glycosyltransferase involved in cell wall biosynthesis
MAGPKVTLGMPVYNGADYLRLSIDSLLTQTYPEFELIISDNGSTDDTEQICREYSRREDRIRYYRTAENRGAAWNFNHLFELAQTQSEYFKWATHDDLCTPTYLERCVAALDAAPPSVVLVYPKTRFIGEKGEVLEDYEDGLDLREPEPHARLRHLLNRLVYSNAAFGLIRAEALSRTRLLGNYPGSDYVLLAELALAGQFWELPERMFLRRIHPNMSRRANPSSREAAGWFDPAKQGVYVPEMWNLLREHIVAIERADLDRVERFQALAVCIPLWLRRHWRPLADEGLTLVRQQYRLR